MARFNKYNKIYKPFIISLLCWTTFGVVSGVTTGSWIAGIVTACTQQLFFVPLLNFQRVEMSGLLHIPRRYVNSLSYSAAASVQELTQMTHLSLPISIPLSIAAFTATFLFARQLEKPYLFEQEIHDRLYGYVDSDDFFYVRNRIMKREGNEIYNRGFDIQDATLSALPSIISYAIVGNCYGKVSVLATLFAVSRKIKMVRFNAGLIKFNHRKEIENIKLLEMTYKILTANNFPRELALCCTSYVIDPPLNEPFNKIAMDLIKYKSF